ncbi:MAG: glutamine--tRNA ligase/YqeY domain fusion protein [Nannocystaceae bacterium]
MSGENGDGPGPISGTDFIRQKVAADVAAKRHGGQVVTRFPPEPNGYLHIGHAKAITLGFSVAAEHPGGRCHLRFDDTNPAQEDTEYVDAIQRDVKWLGFDWGNHLYFASDYFEQMFQLAMALIQAGHAYVCSLSEQEIRAYRGTISTPGRPSPYRDRSVAENVDLFQRMRDGEFEDGKQVLRAKIDMSAANMKLRDPLLYRVRKATHHRTADAWCIYPMYDYAHPLEDAIEGVTHSLCTLEFENNRPLYDWVLRHTGWSDPPQQTEFARLELNYTVVSKRKLLPLVESGRVDGWDDPRLCTLAGLRRRGYTPQALRTFCERVGVAKHNSIVDLKLLEHVVRDELNHRAPRVMVVLRPLRVVITNFPAGEVEQLDASYWPHDVPQTGSRKVPFTRVLYIERDDFQPHPHKKFFRLAPGREVRLRYAYVIKCDAVIHDRVTGEIAELHCSYDPATRGGNTPDGRKIKGTLHWVSAEHALTAEVRLYDRLFACERPGTDGRDLLDDLNTDSLETIVDAKLEPSLAGTKAGAHFQFERQGYFYSDPVTTTGELLVFNRTVSLKDTWAKVSTRHDRAGADATKDPSPKRKQSSISGTLPRLPARKLALTERAQGYVADLGLSQANAEILGHHPKVADLFDAARLTSPGAQANTVANWIVNELMRELKDTELHQLRFDGAAFGELVARVDAGDISGSAGKKVLGEMVRTGERPAAIIERLDLAPIRDEARLRILVAEAVRQNSLQADKFRSGNQRMLGFFIGQIMKQTGGKADAKLVDAMVRRALAE